MFLVVASAVIVVAASVGMSYCLVSCARKEKMDEEERKMLNRLVTLTARDIPTETGTKA